MIELAPDIVPLQGFLGGLAAIASLAPSAVKLGRTIFSSPTVRNAAIAGTGAAVGSAIGSNASQYGATTGINPYAGTNLPQSPVMNGNPYVAQTGRVGTQQNPYGHIPEQVISANGASPGSFLGGGCNVAVCLEPTTEVRVSRAPKGYVTVTDPETGQKAWMLKPIARSLGLWKATPKPPISAAEMKAVNTFARVQKKMKTIATKSGFVCRTKGTARRGKA